MFNKGKITKLAITGVSDTITLGLNWYVHRDNSAIELFEDCKTESNAVYSDTVTTGGRGGTIRKKISGGYIGIMVKNSTANETFSFEKIAADIKPAGRLKI